MVYIGIDTIAIRFLITFLLSLVFGLERQRSHKPIGFGTFVFVSTGSCGLAIAAEIIYPENPMPLLSAIVTGIGFLGAGALIKTTDKIFGFTSAASIWVFAIIGLIIGTGNYIIALVIYLCIWVVLFLDNYLKIKGIGSYQKKVIIQTSKIILPKDIKNILSIGIKRLNLITTEFDKKNHKFCFVYLVEGSREGINNELKRVYEKEWCDSIKVE